MLDHEKVALLTHHFSESPTIHVSHLCTKESQLTEG